MPAQPFDDVPSAARVGAQWAWTCIYEDLAPSVLGYLRGHGAVDPEDLAGEVFVQVVRGLPGFVGGGQEFRAWTFAIAHRRLVDDLRQRGRRPVAAADTVFIERAAGAGGDVHDDAETLMADATVRTAIDGLVPDQRAVMLLRIVGDLTIEEIAHALGKRSGAVKALQRRALRALAGGVPLWRRAAIAVVEAAQRGSIAVHERTQMHLKTTAVSITAALALLASPALAAKPTTTHGKAASPAQLCKSMSHKKTNHGKGKSPYAACVSGAARAKADLAKTPSVKTSPAKLCKDMSKKKSATDSKSPYAACVSGAAKAQAAHS